MVKRLLFLGIFFLVGCLIFGAEYRIGAVFAVTGPASWLGDPEKKTVEMLEEEINSQGGINGIPIRVIVEDTKGDETQTVNAVRKLITRDRVLAIIGPSRSGTTLAVIPIVEKYKVPLVSCAAAEAIVKPVKKWVFKTPQTDRFAVEKIYQYMKKKGIKRIGIITGTTGFGAQGRKHLLALAPKYGIEIVADETYAPQDTDMTPQLLRIKAKNPQAIVNWSIVPGQAIVPRNMKELGMNIPLFQSHGFGNIKYVKAAGEAAEGIIFPAGRLLVADLLPDTHPQKKVLMEYKRKYESRYQEPVSTFGGHAYDAFWLIVNALKAVGPDRAKIRDYIENTKNFVGTGGIFNFSPEDHNGLDIEAFEMLTVKNGKFTLLGD
ncbi:ABC transporter substrate-binding protein [Candidatus Calescamantes bacterium]|nr:ABC transporter substrate-binding protein [Candidatus Calescamantes bacterium]